MLKQAIVSCSTTATVNFSTCSLCGKWMKNQNPLKMKCQEKIFSFNWNEIEMHDQSNAIYVCDWEKRYNEANDACGYLIMYERVKQMNNEYTTANNERLTGTIQKPYKKESPTRSCTIHSFSFYRPERENVHISPHRINRKLIKFVHFVAVLRRSENYKWKTKSK